MINRFPRVTQAPRAFHGLIVLEICLGAWPTISSAQGLTTLRLGSPSVRLDGGEIPFHRISGGRFLSDGSIIIADAGNHRLAIFDEGGSFVGALGREGDGPGEVRSVSQLIVTGDSISVYDPLLNRITLWPSPNAEPQTRRLPTYNGKSTSAATPIAAGQYLLTARKTPGVVRTGLFVDTVDVLRFATGEEQPVLLERVAERYLYFFRQPQGSTTYRTPFLGNRIRVVVGDVIVMVALDATAAVFRSTVDGRLLGEVDLPIAEVPFDRAAIDAYRDSALTRTRGGATSTRIRQAYDGIEMPPVAPAVRAMVSVGAQVWVERYSPLHAEESTWLLLDVEEQRVVAEVSLPATMRPLAGREASVLFLERDELGVETVTVRRLIGW